MESVLYTPSIVNVNVVSSTSEVNWEKSIQIESFSFITIVSIAATTGGSFSGKILTIIVSLSSAPKGSIALKITLWLEP